MKRQFLYALAVLIALGLVLAGAYFSFVYHAPSCSDNVQNQNEAGIDCGGPCAKLCSAPLVSALWAQSVEVAPGVYHAVAMVQNPESDAGTNSLPYTFSLYDASNILIAERKGTMELFPGDIVPLFEANIITGSRTPAHTFVSFGQAVWAKMDAVQNPIRIVSQTLDQTALRLTAHIQNISVYPLANIVLTAFLYDEAGNIVNASQTTVANVAANGQQDIAFTWQQPFTRPVVRFEITPRISE